MIFNGYNTVSHQGKFDDAKNTLQLSKQGYELLDKKRNILIHEMMELIEGQRIFSRHIDETFGEAYYALQVSNIMLGISTVEHIGFSIPIDTNVNVKYRSIMGVEISICSFSDKKIEHAYGFLRTESALDEAYHKFDKVKRLIRELAEVENSVYRLATNIKKTQKRANALKNIMIPRYEDL